jgi:hypothetical protein
VKRLALTFALVSIATLTAGQALAGGGVGAPELDGATKKSGPWVQEQSVKVRKARTLYVRVKSTHDAKQAVTITEETDPTSGLDDYRRKWTFKGKDVSHDVQTSGYGFSLKPGTKKKFSVRVKPRVDDPRAACLYSSVAVDDPPSAAVGAFFSINQPGFCSG